MKLSVVTVSYNGCALLRQTLESFYAVTQLADLEYIVIDNASRDDSVQMVRTEFPQVRLYANQENGGAARAYNQGVQLAHGEYVLFLNPDTVMKEDIVSGLVAFMEAHPQAGAASPRVLWPDGRFQLGVGGFSPSLVSFAGHFWFLDRLSGGRMPAFLVQQRYLHGAATELEWLGAVCMITRRDVFDKVGLYDEQFFVYAEDAEWGERVHRAGYSIHYLAQYDVYHYLGGSSKADPDQVPQSTLWLDSLDLYLRLYNSRAKTIVLEGIALTGFALRLVLYAGLCLIRHRPYDCGKRAQMAGYIRTVWQKMLKPTRLDLGIKDACSN
jgi:GT2 family glycosyltransferase